MRIKSHDYGLAAAGAGALYHLLQNMFMAQMDAIEVPDGHNRWAKIGGKFFKRAEGFHFEAPALRNPQTFNTEEQSKQRK
jgi:hypothetical protein